MRPTTSSRSRREAARVLQVGHIERFNPAVDLLRPEVRNPRFIEVHRLGAFSPRSLDIDVVLDLMIHDLDIVLALDGSEVVQVDAVGVPVLTSRVDIANARLRFASGLIANLTASRVSTEKVRKFRVFSPRTYISADFAAREAQVSRLTDRRRGRPEIVVERTSAPDQEPLRRQLEAFLAERPRAGAAGRFRAPTDGARWPWPTSCLLEWRREPRRVRVELRRRRPSRYGGVAPLGYPPLGLPSGQVPEGRGKLARLLAGEVNQ